MKKLFMMIMVVAMMGSLTACGTIETGNVGVRTAWNGEVNMTEENVGFYTAFFSSVDEFSTKEITVSLNDMKPKAADNLSLADMDLEVYYTVTPSSVAELTVKYAKRNAYDFDLGVTYPAYYLVQSYARKAAYKEVAKYDSLEVHKNRDSVEIAIQEGLQAKLNEDDDGIFTITKVIVRNMQTDPSVENSIKIKVSKTNELEAAKKQVGIAKQQSLANRALSSSLTPAILRDKELENQRIAIEKGAANLTILMGSEQAVPTFRLNK